MRKRARSEDKGAEDPAAEEGLYLDIPVSVQHWLHQNYVVDDKGEVLKSELFAAYEQYSIQVERRAPKKENVFGKFLRHVFPDIQNRRLGPNRNQQPHYRGIRKRASWEDVPLSPSTPSPRTYTAEGAPPVLKKTRTLEHVPAHKHVARRYGGVVPKPLRPAPPSSSSCLGSGSAHVDELRFPTRFTHHVQYAREAPRDISRVDHVHGATWATQHVLHTSQPHTPPPPDNTASGTAVVVSTFTATEDPLLDLSFSLPRSSLDAPSITLVWHDQTAHLELRKRSNTRLAQIDRSIFRSVFLHSLMDAFKKLLWGIIPLSNAVGCKRLEELFIEDLHRETSADSLTMMLVCYGGAMARGYFDVAEDLYHICWSISSEMSIYENDWNSVLAMVIMACSATDFYGPEEAKALQFEFAVKAREICEHLLRRDDVEPDDEVITFVHNYHLWIYHQKPELAGPVCDSVHRASTEEMLEQRRVLKHQLNLVVHLQFAIGTYWQNPTLRNARQLDVLQDQLWKGLGHVRETSSVPKHMYIFFALVAEAMTAENHFAQQRFGDAYAAAKRVLPHLAENRVTDIAKFIYRLPAVFKANNDIVSLRELERLLHRFEALKGVYHLLCQAREYLGELELNANTSCTSHGRFRNFN